ncbi:MAG: 1-acyl-sn-glycerol-3-phosphate acyltransferase [Phycisphaerales bacterium]|nr:1-acyl-sn-glycerol-3-phosphate acyltransferase [Phycisphaerales bacterium]
MRRLQFRRRVPGRSALAILWWDFCETLVRIYLKIAHRAWFDGIERVPREGPCLFVSNHLSFLDPMLNGSAVRDRQISPIARESLFKFKPFGWVLRSVGVIPVKDQGGDAASMRAALAELAAGRCVLIYPEGSRSDDGASAPFKRGVAVLLKRSSVPVLPMAVDGTFDAWPRSRHFPAFGVPIVVRIGSPISHEELLRDGPDAALERLRREIEKLRLEARARLRQRTKGRWPRPGVADRAYWETEHGAAAAS